MQTYVTCAVWSVPSVLVHHYQNTITTNYIHIQLCLSRTGPPTSAPPFPQLKEHASRCVGKVPRSRGHEGGFSEKEQYRFLLFPASYTTPLIEQSVRRCLGFEDWSTYGRTKELTRGRTKGLSRKVSTVENVETLQGK